MLPLEKQVCNKYLSKRLKELGVPQKSLFFWKYDVDPNTPWNERIGTFGDDDNLKRIWQIHYVDGEAFNTIENLKLFYRDEKIYSAFTVSELMEKLKLTIKGTDKAEFCDEEITVSVDLIVKVSSRLVKDSNPEIWEKIWDVGYLGYLSRGLNTDGGIPSKYDKDLVDALAQMLIYLLENKLIKVEDLK